MGCAGAINRKKVAVKKMKKATVKIRKKLLWKYEKGYCGNTKKASGKIRKNYTSSLCTKDPNLMYNAMVKIRRKNHRKGSKDLDPNHIADKQPFDCITFMCVGPNCAW